VKSCLETLREKYPQFSLNGNKNIWIVKPAGLSRGRGIATYNNLVEIMDYVESKESQWVVQKYMENPLLVKNKKVYIVIKIIRRRNNNFKLMEKIE
jgi:tubulin monoglycylase TTLL3/8